MNLDTKNTGNITRGYPLKQKIPIIENCSIAELTSDGPLLSNKCMYVCNSIKQLSIT